MRPILFAAICLICFSTCRQSTDSKRINQLKSSIAESQTALEQVKLQLDRLEQNSPPLIHQVYCQVKSDVAVEELIMEIKKLEAIEGLHELKVGQFKDLGDDRALSKYDLVFQMAFETEADYQVYQKHPIHLALKKKVGQYLTGPPATYDYHLN